MVHEQNESISDDAGAIREVDWTRRDRAGHRPDGLGRRSVLAIIQSGPFRISRNPVYLADTLCYVGVAILLNTAWPLLFLPVVLLVMHRGVILREERYLEQKFGDEYNSYKMRVRRWL